MAHFKPFARARSGAPSHRSSTRRSWSDDSSYHYHRRHRRYRNSGLIVIDLL